MANPEHVARLQAGVEAWNGWRIEEGWNGWRRAFKEAIADKTKPLQLSPAFERVLRDLRADGAKAQKG
jgi:hypothetical protein